jgi:hypothetical protein
MGPLALGGLDKEPHSNSRVTRTNNPSSQTSMDPKFT